MARQKNGNYYKLPKMGLWNLLHSKVELSLYNMIVEYEMGFTGDGRATPFYLSLSFWPMQALWFIQTSSFLW